MICEHGRKSVELLVLRYEMQTTRLHVSQDILDLFGSVFDFQLLKIFC